ncbi:MAG: hypothetical protein KGM47_15315 [Acidobacteriota bacterium]|nr:hypothetical protein [Acidobacteriota bacterium]
MKGSENLPPLALLEMATGYWASQAVYVAAKLGIADVLEGGPRKCVELTRATGAHPPSLCRLQRALVSLGICTIDGQNRIGLTPIGQCLQSNAPGSMRAMVLTLGEEHYQAWGNLLHSVRSGQPAFDALYKMTLFEYLAQNTRPFQTGGYPSAVRKSVFESSTWGLGSNGTENRLKAPL